MRHTAVAIWVNAGANMLEVSKRAGHTSVSFTLDRYGHLFPEADDALTKRIEAVARGKGKRGLAPVIPLTAAGSAVRGEGESSCDLAVT